MQEEPQHPPPLATRWGITGSTRVWVTGHNIAAKREIAQHLSDVPRPPEGPIDVGFIAPLSGDEAIYFAKKIRPRLSPSGVIWLLYPNPDPPGHGAPQPPTEDLVQELVDHGLLQGETIPLGEFHLASCFRWQSDTESR